MKTILIHSFGGADVLSVEDSPRPTPGPGQVLIRVHAASVNPIDYKIRSGAFAREMELPTSLGRDVAGTIDEIGPGGVGFGIGDAVYAYLGAHSGGYAEYALAEMDEVAPKPTALNFVTAAAVPLAAITAWQGLFDHGELEAGQMVLIHGAAGGVGHFAVQFARAKGAMVIATGRAEDLDLLRRLGADFAINYKTERFEEHVSDVDLVLDLVGGETQERSWTVLGLGGRIVSTVQQPSGQKAREHHAKARKFMAKPNALQLRTISHLIDEGEVIVRVDKTLPLERVQEAHEKLEHEHTQGKIVLTVA